MIKDKIPKGIFYTVAAIVGFFGVGLMNIPGVPFVLIVILGTGYIIIHVIKLNFIKEAYKKAKKKYKSDVKKYKRVMKREIKQAKNADEKCEKIAQVLNCSLDNKRYKTKFIKQYSIQYKKIKQKLMISSGAMLCICFFNFNYVTSFAQKILVVVESIQTLDSEQMSEITPTPIQTSTPSPVSTLESALMIPTPKTEKISNIDKNNQKNWIEFKLQHPENYPGITNSEFNDLYNLIFYIDADNLDETMESEVTIWMNSCTINTSLDNVINSKGRSAGYYSEIEEGFSDANGRRLSSDLLDEIIGGREELMDSYPNGSLAWLLANHYQTYALNYLNQTNNKKCILYFYMKSIYNTQESLKFEMDSKNKKERIEYIKFRYKDIAECKILDNEVRIRAYEILIAMDESLNELK